MAHISAAEVQAIRTELKANFPKWRFGVRKSTSGLSVTVTIKQGTLSFERQFKQGKKHVQVNPYWIQDHFQDAAERQVIEQINEIMHNAPGRAGGRVYFDNSDIQSDYFSTAFYTHLQIGDWDRDYQFVAQ
jgi:hypothetical protein